VLTTKPDHNRIRHDPISAGTLMTAVPGERPHPTTRAYFAGRRSSEPGVSCVGPCLAPGARSGASSRRHYRHGM